MSFTKDDTTFASNPGGVVISANKYLSYIGLTRSPKLFYRLLFFFSDSFLFKHFKNNPIVYDWISKKEQFISGCINPTIVLNKDKGLIATFTNLTFNGGRPTPVIKISKEELHLIKNVRVANGQRLSSVAVFYRNTHPDENFWSDFNPKIANCFTNDTEVCNRALTSLTHESFECLQQGLDQVRDKNKIGLYHVQLDDSLVLAAYQVHCVNSQKAPTTSSVNIEALL